MIVAGILATSLAQAQLLAVIPLRSLLKNELHVDRAANAAYFFWLTIPWFLKPIFGIVTGRFSVVRKPAPKLYPHHHDPHGDFVAGHYCDAAPLWHAALRLPGDQHVQDGGEYGGGRICGGNGTGQFRYRPAERGAHVRAIG